MADNESRSPQLEFSFTFDNVEDHIESEVVPRLDNDEKTLPAADSETISEPVKDELVRQFNEEQYHKDFGAWLSFERRLSLKSRQEFNTLAQEIIKKPSAEITGTDRASLRYYSGFGGTGQDNERGVLYDYYTSPPVAGMMWQLLHKIKPIHTGSHILEPSCGTGVFFATAPDDVVLHGVELNPRTAAVARILHPSAHIRNMSFESFNISRLKTYGYDYLIGNAPFGERSADTRFLDMPKEKSLDRYFVSRGIDALKPEGVMALIVHPGVLQNETNESFRTGILRKAWFIGAVRLNDHSFAHSNTNIQPDLLFFQRHPEDIEQSLAAIPGPEVPEVLNAPFNTTYYRLYPQHVMGTISEGSGQWGQDEVHGLITADTLAKVVSDFTPLADANIREQIYENIREKYPAGRTGREKEPDISPASPSTAYHLKLDENEAKDVTSRELQRGSLKIHDHALYVLSDDFIWNRSSDSPDLVNRMKTVLELSHTVRRIRMIMQEREPGESKAVQQQALQSLENYKHEFGTYPQYDPHLLSFIKKFPAVSGIYEGMIDPLTPVISEDNIYRTTHALVNGHNPAIDALYTLREHLQAATREAIHRWFPHDADNLIQEMDKHPDVFLTPENEYQLREDYLSGNVWEKIDELEKLKVKHSQDPDITGRYTRYQDELRKATNWTTLEEAHITPHLSWISESVVNSFLHSEYCPRHSLFRLKTVAKNEEGKWGVINGKKEWEPFNDPVIYYLNYQKQRGKYVDTEMFNKEYNEAFSSFISNDPQYRDTIENTFNRLFNAEVKSPVKTYPVFIDGWTHAKTPKPHQMQSFHHLYRQQKGLSALGTGFGKTLVAISLYSVLKQEGKINRAFFQVPNNKVKDWVQEFTDVMPSLRIGYIDPEMPGYASREKRYAAYHRLANTPYDLLIFPESSAGEIQLNPQNDRFIVGNVISRHL
jgi:hypothetical protein